MDLNQILADHGFGGGQGLQSFFGDGSDGAFNPTLNTVSGNAVMAADNSYYTATSVTANASTQSTGAAMAMGIVSVAGETARSGVGSTVNIPSNYSYGSRFTVSAAGTINGVEVYTVDGGKSISIALWDVTHSSVLATVSATTVANGWTRATFTSPISLQLSTTYQITLENSSGAALNASFMGATNQTVAFTFSQPTTYTFTVPTLDGAPVVKNFTSINIPAYLTVTVSQRCKGLIMLCQGDVTISGTVSMDGLAALADPTDMTNNPAFAVIDQAKYLDYPLAISGKQKVIVIGPGGIGGAGGNGGQSASSSSTYPGAGGNPTSGTWWGGGRGGGGGGGACSSGSAGGGNGGDAAYTGSGTPGAAPTTSNGQAGNPGTGGAGGSGQTNSTAYPCGSGGYANGAGGGGGGGATADTASGQNGANSSGGAGGLIMIVAKGNVTINSGGTLTAKGSAGANGGNAGFVAGTSWAGGGGGGGGAGGGIVALLYKGAFTNNGTTNVQGGSGGTGGVQQGASYANGKNGKSGVDGQVLAIAV